MKTLVFIIIILFLFSCGGAKKESNHELQDLYAQLDDVISQSKTYEDIKEDRIKKLIGEYRLTRDHKSQSEITDNLIREYEAYNADSALYYINMNLQNPYVRSVPGLYTKMMIKKADVFGHAGLFSDALTVMDNIPSDSLSLSLLEEYYSTYCSIYQYLTEYTSEHETAREYEDLRTAYADSIRQVADTSSLNHMVYVMTERVRRGESEEAIIALRDFLNKYPEGTREYSILASILAYIYKITDAPEEYKKFLVLSAISDVKGATKENMSFREMATVMFEEGDVERANRYLKKSISDANFYSALMLNAQSAKMLPVIDDAYSLSQKKLTSRLRGLVIATAILATVLVITLIIVLYQFIKVRREHQKVNILNGELKELTENLGRTNEELKKNNLIKEQYAGLFMEYCATSISILDHYQKSLRLMANQSAKHSALIKKIESSEIVDELRKNFYEKFDEAILSIYPLFVEKFNALMEPEYKVVLKSGELLNTELRIFALIRLGIDDSSHIAQFLQCSISTIYTYRSKMKKRALSPETFDEEVKKIE